jgi:hypothetical protein
MNDQMMVLPSVLAGKGKARPDLHYDDVKDWPAAKIRIYFHLPKRPMTKTFMLNAIRSRCQPVIGGVTNEPLPDALVNLSIHKLRKLAGFKKLEKGISKSDYIRIIREGK